MGSCKLPVRKKNNFDICIIRIFCIIYIILVLKNHVEIMNEMFMQYITVIPFQDLCSFILFIFSFFCIVIYFSKDYIYFEV